MKEGAGHAEITVLKELGARKSIGISAVTHDAYEVFRMGLLSNLVGRTRPGRACPPSMSLRRGL